MFAQFQDQQNEEPNDEVQEQEITLLEGLQEKADNLEEEIYGILADTIKPIAEDLDGKEVLQVSANSFKLGGNLKQLRATSMNIGAEMLRGEVSYQMQAMHMQIQYLKSLLMQQGHEPSQDLEHETQGPPKEDHGLYL
ncbi:MAG: hypothetical protein R3251_03135 [Candidatus Spechtbacterales bacterium]|nr:hypothetical protein [Candidatus Spechtbacterales bacterium]